MKTTPDALPRAAASPLAGRARVRQALLELGPTTASRIAEHLELTPSAVRKQLDALLAAGVVTTRTTSSSHVRRGRGRPSRVFVLTDAGRETFGSAYDDVAVGALRYLADACGPDAVQQFAQARVGELEARYRAVVDAAGNKPAALAAALSADGYAAAVRPTAAVGGVQLCQHHCPVAHVAAAFPELCEAETEAFARLLGTHVQRLATIAHGDAVCTTHVPTSTGTTPAPFTTSGRTPA